ncbi:MAG: T9SS type A sorting domain-containing protein, partial [Muribaculaceae bacterium]|nr:T9SS type A sorting domain-containing protein [Muribaculaceae bacterium]
DNTRAVIQFDGNTISVPGHTVELYTAQGLRAASGYESIDTARLQPGIYIVSATNGNLCRATAKVVIK